MRHIDIHSHFFNIQYAFREALVIARDVIWGDYPFGYSSLSPDDINWQSFTNNLRELVYAAVRSCENQLKYHQQSFRDSNIPDRGAVLITTPLAMDIYYVAARDIVDPFSADQEVTASDLPGIPELQGRLTRVAEDIYEGVESYVKSIGFDQIAHIYDDFTAFELEEAFFHDLKDILSESWRLLLKRTEHLSWGFETQIRDIIGLKNEHSELIYPFFAVDPRRPNLMKYVSEYVRNEPPFPFSGIKLYPPLGYLPSHPNLLPVWEHCLRYDLPICVHASDRGFPSLATTINARSFVAEDRWVSKGEGDDAYWVSRYFSDPHHWEDVLNYKHPELPELDFSRLRVNFAHFGAQYGATRFESDWTEKIIDYMRRFENIYADLSDRSDVSVQDIDDLVKLPGNSIVGDRLMFGTDYPVTLLEERIGKLSDYFAHYRDLPISMFCRNAQSYLAGILDHRICAD